MTNDELAAELARAVFPIMKRHEGQANIANVRDPEELYRRAAAEQRAIAQAAQPQAAPLDEYDIAELAAQTTDADDLYKLAARENEIRRQAAGR